MTTEILLRQSLALTFAVMAAYHSFMALNAASRTTAARVRWTFVAVFVTSCGVVVSVADGLLVPWPITLFIVAVGIKLAAERRSVNRGEQQQAVGKSTRGKAA